MGTSIRGVHGGEKWGQTEQRALQECVYRRQLGRKLGGVSTEQGKMWGDHRRTMCACGCVCVRKREKGREEREREREDEGEGDGGRVEC